MSVFFCMGTLFGLENRKYSRRDPSRGILYPQKLTSPTNGGRSVGIARSRT
jgi:hypothetical protein